MVVDFEVRGRTGIITIRRPEARNAVNGEVANAIESAVDELEANPDIWVGILAGDGPVFCAGADLKAVAAGRSGEINTKRGGFGGFVKRERTKPFIAAVDGPALAGGTELVLACDLVVAASNATFGLPEVKRSLVAAAGGLFRLPRALPAAIAMEVALTGDPITAERAYHFGLVNQLVDPGTALAGAAALADRILANAPIAVRVSRRLMLASTGANDDALWKLTFEAMAEVAGTEDFAEGPRAFIEKRPPVWKGR
jgi:enoyl-CoA hydratase/carnithine racemase